MTTTAAPPPTFSASDPALHWNAPMPEKPNVLSHEQIQFYRDNGYVVAKGLLSKSDATMYRRECHDLAARLMKHKNIDATWGAAREAVASAKDTVIQHCHDV